MKLIPLTQDKFAQVDDEDYELLNQHRWYAIKLHNIFYARRYISVKNGKWEFAFMHREILGLTDPKIFADHYDHNGLNNQRYNLRVATSQQNSHNRRKHINNLSGYKGVSLSSGKRRKKWTAYIYVNGKNLFLGRFTSQIEASLAYNDAAKKYFGEFAHLN